MWGGGNVRKLLGCGLQGEMPELGEEAMDDGALGRRPGWTGEWG